MTTATWKPALSAPEGVVVMTRSPGGQEQPLVRSGNLWFFPDRSMYVYYTPDSWMPLRSEEHPAHSGHEYGGAYARGSALAAGDPDWMNATGGTRSDADHG